MAEHVEQRCKPRTREEYRRSVELFILPKIGSHKVIDVTRAEIAKLHHGFRDIPYQANRTLGVLSKMFNLAEIWGLRPDGSNPCRHVKKYPEKKRERFLSPEELKRLGDVLNAAERDKSESPYVLAAFGLLILTGCRLGEIQTLQWQHVEGDSLALPDSKTGAKRVYLGKAAQDILARIPRTEGNPYVIAGEIDGQYWTDLQRPWRRIRKAAGLDDVRIHDLRHSFASSAVAMGEHLPMIGKLLGHRLVQTTARYAHLADDPVKASAERISNALSETLFGRHDLGE
jgi:integrase